MKVKVFLILIFIVATLTTIKAQGIEFFHGTWDEALQKAKKEDKLIFVDAYTTWCGPCKRLQKQVFPKKIVGDMFNKYFISVKMNMESQEGMKFGLKYPVGAYPTLLFISPKGKIVHTHIGGRDIKKFIELGKTALKAHDKSPDLEKEWEKGNRDYEFVLKYIKALNLADKPTNKVALSYLRSKPDISKDEKAVLLFEATSECDSKLFETMTKKKFYKRLKDIYSKQELSDKIYNACWKTVMKSYEFDFAELKEEAKSKMKKLNKKRYKDFKRRIELFDAENKNDINIYLKVANSYFKLLEDTKSRLSFIDEVGEKFSGDKAIRELVENLTKKTFEKDKTPKTYTKYVNILISNKKFDLARKHLGKAIKMAKEQKDATSVRTLNRYKRYIQKMK